MFCAATASVTTTGVAANLRAWRSEFRPVERRLDRGSERVRVGIDQSEPRARRRDKPSVPARGQRAPIREQRQQVAGATGRGE